MRQTNNPVRDGRHLKGERNACATASSGVLMQIQTAKEEMRLRGRAKNSQKGVHHSLSMKGDCRAVDNLIEADKRKDQQAAFLIAEREASRARRAVRSQQNRNMRFVAVPASSVASAEAASWEDRSETTPKRRTVRRLKRIIKRDAKARKRRCWVEECQSGGLGRIPVLLVLLDEEDEGGGEALATRISRVSSSSSTNTQADGAAVWTALGRTVILRLLADTPSREGGAASALCVEMGMLRCGVALAALHTRAEAEQGQLQASEATVRRLQQRAVRLLGAELVPR